MPCPYPRWRDTSHDLPMDRMSRPDAGCAGVRLKGGETLPADLVVDASGRVSAVQSWLREGGYAPPRTVEVNAGVGYSGAIFGVPQEVCV